MPSMRLRGLWCIGSPANCKEPEADFEDGKRFYRQATGGVIAMPVFQRLFTPQFSLLR